MSIAQPVEYSTGSLSHAVSGRPRGGAVAGTALITLLALALLALLCGPAQAKLSAVGPVDSATSFPSYYQDSTGMRLSPCLDGPPLCFASPSDLVAPDGEAFYNNATANLTTRNNGKAVMVLALEAAYAASGSNQQIVFSRIRFSDSGGLQANTNYKVTHPFGVDTFKTDANGAVPKNVGTNDVGALGPCIAANAHSSGGACDFAAAMTGRFGPFLKWDPKVAPAAPAGYLGDNATPHAITGSPNNTNLVRIEGPNVNPTPTVDKCPTISGSNANCVETNLFTVEGRIAGPLAVNPSPVAFGSQQVGTTSAATAVTVKNIGATALTLSGVALDTTGNPADFAIAPGGTCTVGRQLATDGTCTVNVQFAPKSVTGTRTASLMITHNGIRSPERVALRGSAAPAGGAPQVAIQPATGGLTFANTWMGTQSDAQPVRITNTGNADLNVRSVAFAGTDANDFTAQNDCVGVAVAPNNTCTINVVFGPRQTAGAKTASLQITDDASGSPRTVALTGTAQSGLDLMGAIDTTNGFPTTYHDVNNVTLKLCLDGPPNCFATPADLVAPDGEAFYNNATAKLTTRNSGKAVMVLAMEAAYAGAGSGQEIVFTRIRFSDSGGLVPNAPYKVTHPYGVDTYTANASGQIPKNAGTQDIGALGPCTTTNAHAAGGVCDFAAAMTGRFGPFLKWDPAVAPAAPAGYLGDSATPHAVTGSPNNTNFVRIQGPGINPNPTVDACPTVSGATADCVETNLFTVEGKLAQ